MMAEKSDLIKGSAKYSSRTIVLIKKEKSFPYEKGSCGKG
jgi:hypothetical protein